MIRQLMAAGREGGGAAARRLADFNLVDVLQVLSVSRQCIRVDHRLLTGSVFIKNGKVVQAANARSSALPVPLLVTSARPPVALSPNRTRSGIQTAAKAPAGHCIKAIANRKAGSGKPTVALNLDLSRARCQRAVILFDGDLTAA
jgi:Mrp family chromosome partitioning ATPase